jgi:hypothetical protein
MCCASCRSETDLLIAADRAAGEIHEFKQDINSMDRNKKKETVKKIIAGGCRVSRNVECPHFPRNPFFLH